MEVSGQLSTPAAFPPGKQPPYPLYKRLGGPQSLFRHYGEEKNLLPLPGMKPRFLGRSAISLVARPTKLAAQESTPNWDLAAQQAGNLTTEITRFLCYWDFQIL
jgi:hypothetical protein